MTWPEAVLRMFGMACVVFLSLGLFYFALRERK